MLYRMSPYVMTKGILFLMIILANDFEWSNADERTPFKRSRNTGYIPQKYVRRPSVGRSDLRVLFPTAAALGGIYIARKMRSRVRPSSYLDLYDYTVCEGPKREYIDRSGEYHTFSHFLCPDDPNQMFERYCCRDSLTGEGICCSYDELSGLYQGISKWAILGGCIALLGILVMIALVVYCCCFAKRSQKKANPVQPAQQAVETKSTTNQGVPQPSGFLPYPMAASSPTMPPVQMYGPPAPYPIPPQVGTAWTTNVPFPGSSWQQQPYQEPPPPPYPGTEPVGGGKSARPYPS